MKPSHTPVASCVVIRVNGVKVNEAFDVYPPAGKILRQMKGFEIDFRGFELQPLRLER